MNFYGFCWFGVGTGTHLYFHCSPQIFGLLREGSRVKKQQGLLIRIISVINQFPDKRRRDIGNDGFMQRRSNGFFYTLLTGFAKSIKTISCLFPAVGCLRFIATIKP
jgi:hypothetical protein